MIYIVVKNGIYRHDIWGAWADEQSAVAFASALALADEDCYHDYEILELSTDGSGGGKIVGSVQASPAEKNIHRRLPPATVIYTPSEKTA